MYVGRILKAVSLGVLLAGGVYGAASQSKPNIVLFFVDDLGWADCNYRNSTIFETPNIDALARGGIDFEQAYIASPCCSASRATLLTGKHPARLKMVRHTYGSSKVAKPIYDENGRASHHLWLSDPAQFPSKNWVDLDQVTYAEALKELGYYNLFLGKWHVGHEEHHPVKQGFDRQIGTTNQGNPSNYYPDYFNTSDVFSNEKEQYLTDKLTDEAVDFIKGYDKSQPFMMSFWYYNVHTPHIGRKDLVKHFKAKGLAGKQAEYAAMVASVDESIGRVREALQEKEIDQETIVILLSDQGGYFENPPFHGNKHNDTLYEGGARVPFFFNWPGVTKVGAVNSSVVQSTDLFPTLVEIAGGDISKYAELDGVSLVSTIRGNCELNRGAPVYGYRAYEDLYLSVREGDWKLLAYRSGIVKLYNIAEDIREQNDLASSRSDIVNKLKKKAVLWEHEMGVQQYSGLK
ncbi:sulfatase [Pontiella sulfatireligans]|uniref:Arylsulfatase n=1 Tax=Pontiella sulfatireligans TaxID=2750658 RepID=A0A6C2UGL1_9BACT|nr:sulfatase [Pontiella sulfatireligans]SPS74316.1 sulfatase S1_16 [Kiritimatiellales bacterium]VGO19315.1 Arylsulfatase [Pontiella sulfatireligans]